MGNFYNMIIVDDFTAIRYEAIYGSGDNQFSGVVTEFVRFKDYGLNLVLE